MRIEVAVAVSFLQTATAAAAPAVEAKTGFRAVVSNDSFEAIHMVEEVRKKLLESVMAANMEEAEAIVESWIVEHGYERTLGDLVEPALRHGGELWEEKCELNLAQGYIAARVLEKVLLGRIDALPVSGDVVKGPVVLGNAEDDFHFLGRKMVSAFLRANGWQVIDLGNDVPAATFVDKAVEVGAKVIGVSAMTYTNAKNIAAVRKEIDSRGLGDEIQLAVGGAVFVLRPELVEQVGGDGTAQNAMHTPALFERLEAKVRDTGCALSGGETE